MPKLNRRVFCVATGAGALSLVGCAQLGGRSHLQPALASLPQTTLPPASQIAWLNRVTWGVNASSQAELAQRGLTPWLLAQLSPTSATLPPAAQAQIDAMTISRNTLVELMRSLEAQRKSIEAMTDVAQKQTAEQAYQDGLQRLLRESQQRFLLRALYSPNQLQEQMTWFWMNHFNVNSRKENLRAVIGDFEEQAVRPHALGQFRALLGATVRHPAMLRYLDNVQNANNRINENYARELMELHTLGVNGGYTQADVQTLARVLTGVGVKLRPLDGPAPNMSTALAGDYVREGLFEFNPARHDYGPKTLLGKPLTAKGLGETDEALDRLARAPATAQFIARKLAVYFVADAPPQKLVDAVADSFTRSDGDIAATLATLFASKEFSASLGQQFRDPVHYLVAGVRLAYGDRVVTNVAPMLNWLNRMGEPLYVHPTPDGYPLLRSAWSSAGQMTARFEVARLLGANGAVLFRANDSAPLEAPAFPPLAASPAVVAMQTTLGAPTRKALAEAKSPQDWNTYLLASPEFMNR